MVGERKRKKCVWERSIERQREIENKSYEGLPKEEKDPKEKRG